MTRTLLIALVLVLVSATDVRAADSPEEVAGRMCSGLLAKLGADGFQRRFPIPEDCPSVLRADAAAAVAACGDVSDCLSQQIQRVVRTYAGDATVAIYTTRSGAQVRVAVAEGYAVDARRWADFLDSLEHGDEITTVTLHLAPLADVLERCGFVALACYEPETATMHATGTDSRSGSAATSLIAHEYGHHVAASASNAPWSATETGTKRWATHMHICESVHAHEIFLHAPWGLHYRLDPGEGFAEAYRVLNEHRLGIRKPSWPLVDRRFYPTTKAERVLAQDVRHPWRAPTRLLLSGRGTRAFRIATPLDGDLRVRLSTSAGSTYRVDAPRRVCGERTIVIRVHLLQGHGAFRLQLFRP